MSKSIVTLLLLMACVYSSPARLTAQETKGASELAKEISELRAEIDKLKAVVSKLEGAVGKEYQGPFHDLRFTGVYVNPDGKRTIGEFTTRGPIASTLKPLPEPISKLAIDAKSNTIYGRGHHEVYRATFEELKFEKLPAADPAISWLSAVAFDSKRNRLLASTFGGRGYLYAFDPNERKWSVLAEPGLEASALTYVEADDALFGVNLAMGPDDYIQTLYKFGSDGATLSQKELSEHIAVRGDFGSTQLIWADGWLVLLQGQMTRLEPQHRGRRRPLSRGYIIDPKSAEVVYSWDNRLQ